jgi:hypothetical protein
VGLDEFLQFIRSGNAVVGHKYGMYVDMVKAYYDFDHSGEMSDEFRLEYLPLFK